jgi:hypothetical protein
MDACLYDPCIAQQPFPTPGKPYPFVGVVDVEPLVEVFRLAVREGIVEASPCP